MREREINCFNCRAACCQSGINVEFTPEEARFILSGTGTKLGRYVQEGKDSHPGPDDGVEEIDSWPAGFAWQMLRRQLEGNPHALYKLYYCGHIVERDGWLQCGVYNDPNRPSKCRDFATGDRVCREIRRGLGIDKGLALSIAEVLLP